MAGLAQTTIQKINHWYERILPKWPAEVTPRNVLIFCVVALLCIGSVMVASASMPYAEYMHEKPISLCDSSWDLNRCCWRGGLFNLSNITQYMV